MLRRPDGTKEVKLPPAPFVAGIASTSEVLGIIIAGLIAGWLTGKLMRGRGYGIIADILLGLVGAVIGQAIFAHLGVLVYGRIGFIAMAVVGAVILVAIIHLIRGPDYRTT